MTLAHGLFDGQFLSTFLAMVACPHCVPFVAGGNGRYLPSKRMSSKQPILKLEINKCTKVIDLLFVPTFLEVTIDFKCSNTGVFRFSTSVNSFLFIHH